MAGFKPIFVEHGEHLVHSKHENLPMLFCNQEMDGNGRPRLLRRGRSDSESQGLDGHSKQT